MCEFLNDTKEHELTYVIPWVATTVLGFNFFTLFGLRLFFCQ